MVPEQKHASPYQRDQRGTKVQFGVVNLAAADDLGILKVNHLVPEMVLGNPPDANKERSGDEQKEQQGFRARLSLQEELLNTSSDGNKHRYAGPLTRTRLRLKC